MPELAVPEITKDQAFLLLRLIEDIGCGHPFWDQSEAQRTQSTRFC